MARKREAGNTSNIKPKKTYKEVANLDIFLLNTGYSCNNFT